MAEPRLPAVVGSALLIAGLLGITGSASAVVARDTVYAQDFEGGLAPLPPEWSTGSGTFGAATGSYSGLPDFATGFLQNATVPPLPSVLRLQNLPAHTHLDIGFLLAIIDSWDGVGGSPGPDALNVVVDGALVFSHVFGRASGSTDYSPPPGVSLGNGAYNMYGEPLFQDIVHTADNLTVQWFASGPGWQGGNDESWAIDHVQVVLLGGPPEIDSFAPTEGVVGDTVQIVGHAFAAPLSVAFNGVQTIVVSTTTTSIDCIVPEGAATGPISVTTTVGTGNSATDFVVHPTPTIATATPSSGKPGAHVVIAGSHFTEVTAVRFGLGGAATFEVASDNEIRATVDLAATSGPITVTTPFVEVHSSFDFTVVPLDPRPIIRAVYDTPNDQGGHVFLTWDRSDFDRDDLRRITAYRVWRRAPHRGVDQAAVEPGETPLQPEPGNAATATEYWEAIGTLPASFLDGYAFDAPTTQDSLPNANPFTAFFVQALTANQFLFYNSPVDSGYSVDNLAPPQPLPFAAVYGAADVSLHWTTSRAPDFREFRLYRGSAANFVPGAGNIVLATRDTAHRDVPPQTATAYYKLSAVDVHGNGSRFALVSPATPVAALASLVSAEAREDRIRLTWYAGGNVGVSAAVYRRADGEEWTQLGSIDVDGAGFLRFEDLNVVAGARYGYRLGFMDAGGELFAGEVWLTAENPAFALEELRPNPASSEELVVQFVLSGAAEAKLALFDVSGRQVAQRDVGELGAGRHTVNLAAGTRLPPGVYLVRLTQGDNVRVARGAILR